jgi:hypothetical protein
MVNLEINEAAEQQEVYHHIE